MKAVVLAAGAGTRLRPIAYSMAKQLIPIANKPILFYALEDVAAAGVSDVVIVVAPDTGDEIRLAVGDGSRFGLAVEFVTQDEPLGIAHAFGLTKPWVGDDDVLLYLGDNMLKEGVSSTVDAFVQGKPNCQILLSRVRNPERFGVVTMNDAGGVVELVEKPRVPASDLALAGVYLFDSTIWEAIDSLRPSGRGEYEITEAIQWLLDTGNQVAATEVEGWWKDTGQKQDLLEANDLVLADLEPCIEGSVDDSSTEGAVRLGVDSEIVGCQLIGPVVVGSGTRVSNSTLGPGVCVGAGCRIEDAHIERSVVLDGAVVEAWKLHDSLLGRHTVLGRIGPEGSVSMTLGERSEVTGT